MPRSAPRKYKPRRKAMRKPVRRAAYKEETAACKETHQFALLTNNTAYFDYEVSLARFGRAASIGANFREFRITKVEYIFKPKSDTFIAGTNSTIPTLLYVIDKTGSMRDFNTPEELRRAGARPIRFDDKQITTRYKPAVLQYARDENGGTNLWAKPLVSPWLSCNRFNDDAPLVNAAPSSIDHLGIVWMVEQTNSPPDPLAGYEVEMVAHFQFRKPTWLRAIPPPGSVGAKQAPGVNTQE